MLIRSHGVLPADSVNYCTYVIYSENVLAFSLVPSLYVVNKSSIIRLLE